MSKSLLAMKTTNGSMPGRVVGATPTTVGTLSTSDETAPGLTVAGTYVRPMNRILQFSRGGNLSTTIAVGSNGASLPQSTINVVSIPAGTPTKGTLYVVTGAGTETVTYTGVSGNSFTGCTGGSGVMSTGGAVTIVTKVIQVLWQQNGIYSFDGINWTLRYTLSPALQNALTTAAHTGLYLVMATGVPTIVGTFISNSGGSLVGAITSTDGINWTQTTSAINVVGDFRGHHGEAIFNNVLYYLLANGTSLGFIITFDPASNTFASTTVSDMNFGSPADIFVYGNALYILAESVASHGYWVWNLSAGSWSKIVQLGHPGNSSVTNQSSAGSWPSLVNPVLFDGGDGFAYAIYVNMTSGSNYGYACAQLTLNGASGSSSDVTSAVLPSSWGYGHQPGTFDFTAFAECETTPTTPTIHLFLGPSKTVGTPFQYYVWNGPATLIGISGSPNDSGGDIAYAMPHVTDGGSDRIWVPGDFDIAILGRAPDTGGVLFFFQAYGLLGTETKSVGLFFSVADDIPTAVGHVSHPDVVATTIASGSNGASLPQATINVADTTGFPTAGTIFVQSSALATTIASGSNGASLPQATIHAVNTTGFATEGVLLVTTGAGVETVHYTGISGNDFTGCTGGSGLMTTGGSLLGLQPVTYTGISGNSFTGCTGGSGTLATGGDVLSGPSSAPTLNINDIQLDGAVADGNTKWPTTYKFRWEAQADGLNTNQRFRANLAVS